MTTGWKGKWSSLSPNEQVKLICLVLLLLIHIALTFFTITPGHMSIDEGVYHWQVRDLINTGGLISWTGYREFPSVELIHHFFRINDGLPVTQYPHVFAILTAPLYLMFGFYGVFLFNSMAFVALLVLVYKLSSRLFGSTEIALDSCLILTLAGFVWEYSQAAWPHMTAILLVVSAFYLAVISLQSGNRSRAVFFALLAGLIAGFSPGVRLDCVLVLPCLMIPFLLSSPTRIYEILAIAAGSAPGALTLSYMNLIKFSSFNPLTYGKSFSGYQQTLPWDIIVLGAAFLVFLWIVSRKQTVSFLGTRSGKIVGLVIAALIIAASMGTYYTQPKVKGLADNTLNRGYTTTVDIRNLAWNKKFPALSRSGGGGLVYLNAHKKALLQSMPFLVIIVVPIIASFRGLRSNYEPLLLLIVPAAVFAFYWKNEYGLGGLCLNYRFFLPAIPFLVILGAKSLDLIRKRSFGFSWVIWSTIVIATLFSFWFLTREIYPDIDRQEFPLLTIPLGLVLALIALIAIGLIAKGKIKTITYSILWVFGIIAMAWSSAAGLMYDYPTHRAQRIKNYRSGELVKKIIPPNSVFFTHPFIDAGLRALEIERVRIGFPRNDKFKDFPNIVEFYLNKNIRVFGLFPKALWLELLQGTLSDYQVKISAQFGPVIIGEIVSGLSRGS